MIFQLNSCWLIGQLIRGVPEVISEPPAHVLVGLVLPAEAVECEPLHGQRFCNKSRNQPTFRGCEKKG
jgi:hypothetical protein